MSAVNEKLDRRAYAAEHRPLGGFPSQGHKGARIVELEQQLQSLDELNDRLLLQMVEQRSAHETDHRMLRGLTKLVKAATYNPTADTLTISPLELHADADISYVWRIIQASKGAPSAP